MEVGDDLTLALFSATLGNGTPVRAAGSNRLALWLDWMDALAAHGRPLEPWAAWQGAEHKTGQGGRMTQRGEAPEMGTLARHWVGCAMFGNGGIELLPILQWDEARVGRLLDASGYRLGEMVEQMLGTWSGGGAESDTYARLDQLLARRVEAVPDTLEARKRTGLGAWVLGNIVRGGSEATLAALLGRGAGWDWSTITGIRTPAQWDMLLASGVDPVAPFPGRSESPAQYLEKSLREGGADWARRLRKHIQASLEARGAQETALAQVCEHELMAAKTLGEIDKIMARNRRWRDYPSSEAGVPLAEAWLRKRPEHALHWMLTRGRLVKATGATSLVGAALPYCMHALLYTLGNFYGNEQWRRKADAVEDCLPGAGGEGLFGQVAQHIDAGDNGLAYESGLMHGNNAKERYEPWFTPIAHIPPHILWGTDEACQARAAGNLRSLLGLDRNGHFLLDDVIVKFGEAFEAAARVEGLIVEPSLRAEMAFWHGIRKQRHAAGSLAAPADDSPLDAPEWALDGQALLPITVAPDAMLPGRYHQEEKAAVLAVLEANGFTPPGDEPGAAWTPAQALRTRAARNRP